MPNLITDTSPIQYLYQADLLDLLPTLYGQVLMPMAVVEELAQGRIQGVLLPEPESRAWITQCQVPQKNLITVSPHLGRGERAVLTLAQDTPDVLVLLDDALARAYAQQLGIPMTGTGGIAQS